MAGEPQAQVTVTSGQGAKVLLGLKGAPFCDTTRDINYDNASSYISPLPAHKDAFKVAIERLKAAKGGKLVVVGHTDALGSDQLNNELSTRRANGVLAVLTGNTAVWEKLYKDEIAARFPSPWGDDQFAEMLVETGLMPAGTRDPVLISTHREISPAGTKLRENLFKNYFEKLLGAPPASITVRSTSPPTVGCGKKFVLGPGNHPPSRRAEFIFFLGKGDPLIAPEEYPKWLSPCGPLVLPPAGLNNFFVSTSGDDANGTGSSTNPWRTIKHSLDEIAKKRKSGEHVTLKASGDKFEENVVLPDELTLEGIGERAPVVSGTADAPVIDINGVRNTEVKKIEITKGKRSGIRINKARNITISACVIFDNFSPRGGGISVVESDQVTIEKNLIEENKGGTIATAIPTFDIDFNLNPLSEGFLTFEINAVLGGGHGGGIFVEGSTKVNISLNRITDNQAILFGGGIAVDNQPGFAGELQVVANSIVCNQVSHSDLTPLQAAGITCESNDMGDPVLSFIASQMIESAGILPDAVLLFIKGLAPRVVKLLHGVGLESGMGGGVALRQVGSNTVIARNSIGSSGRPNRARRGGGIECYIGAYPRIEQNSISANLVSDDGGGIAIDEFDPFFPESEPSALGFKRGRMFRRQPIEIISNTVSSNRSIEDGGGLYATGNARLNLTQNTFSDNRAGENGGGIRISYATQMTATDTKITGNEANFIGTEQDGGGGLAARNSAFILNGCEMSGNKANGFAGGAILATTSFEGGFDSFGSFIANRPGQFDEIMEKDYRFGKRIYKFINCRGSDNSATGSSGTGGFLYGVRDSTSDKGFLKGGKFPIDISIEGDLTAIGKNVSTYNNPNNPGGALQKRGNVVFELSGQQDPSNRPEDRVLIDTDVPDVPTGIKESEDPATSTSGPAVVVIHHDGSRADEQPITFPYQNISPVVKDVQPSFGPVAGGVDVRVKGEGFLKGTNSTKSPKVFIDGEECVTTFGSSEELQATTPPSSTNLPKIVGVEVINADGKNAGKANAYEYTPAPTVGKLKPDVAPINQSVVVVISGTNFRQGATVEIGGKPATVISIKPDRKEITAQTPQSLLEGVAEVIVRNLDGQSGRNPQGFRVSIPPVIFDVTPPFGPIDGGGFIKIIGSGFAPGIEVSIPTLLTSRKAQIITLSPVEIAALTPASPTNLPLVADVAVTNSDGLFDTKPNGHEYTGPPVIDPAGVQPNQATNAASTVIIITGSNFRPNVKVTIGGQPAQASLRLSSTRIQALTNPLPTQQGKVNVEVENEDGQKAILRNGFTYL
jgi:hypothetical protein